MSGQRGAGYTLDAGGLIAIERGDARLRKLLSKAIHQGLPVTVPATALAQAWRDGRKQTRLAAFLAQPEVSVIPLDTQSAKTVGIFCGKSRHSDITDVHVVVNARAYGHHVVTSDPGDLRRIDPGLGIVEV